jgi:hypothetical protein
MDVAALPSKAARCLYAQICDHVPVVLERVHGVEVEDIDARMFAPSTVDDLGPFAPLSDRCFSRDG